MEEIEQELGIDTCPVNWPIGSGKQFKGVYERDDQEVIRFIPVDGGRKEVDTKIMKYDDPELINELDDELYNKLQDDIELLDMAGNNFDLEKVRQINFLLYALVQL